MSDPSGAPPAISLQALVREYRGRGTPLRALDGVSLDVAPGEIYGIVGRSGAGKSTLLRCVNLLERPDSGRVTVLGQEITALDEAALRRARRGIGMVFQHFNLLSSSTVAGNIAFPLEIAGVPRAEREARVAELLPLVGLEDRRDYYPAQLSGGQKQRVGIARALASRPKVLLCDEATSALDPETTEEILSLIRSIRDRLDLTVLLITHEMSVVKAICDRVAVPNDPSNGGRALVLLAKARLFSLKEGADHTATVADITANPKRIRVTELEAAQIPRALEDVDLAAINTNFAVPAGLNPVRDSLAIESGDSPYANLIAVRTQDRDAPWVRRLLAAYQNDEVKRFVETTFQGAAIPAF